jgi:hypothetical protein
MSRHDIVIIQTSYAGYSHIQQMIFRMGIFDRVTLIQHPPSTEFVASHLEKERPPAPYHRNLAWGYGNNCTNGK